VNKLNIWIKTYLKIKDMKISVSKHILFCKSSLFILPTVFFYMKFDLTNLLKSLWFLDFKPCTIIGLSFKIWHKHEFICCLFLKFAPHYRRHCVGKLLKKMSKKNQFGLKLNIISLRVCSISSLTNEGEKRMRCFSIFIFHIFLLED